MAGLRSLTRGSGSTHRIFTVGTRPQHSRYTTLKLTDILIWFCSKSCQGVNWYWFKCRESSRQCMHDLFAAERIHVPSAGQVTIVIVCPLPAFHATSSRYTRPGLLRHVYSTSCYSSTRRSSYNNVTYQSSYLTIIHS